MERHTQPLVIIVMTKLVHDILMRSLSNDPFISQNLKNADMYLTTDKTYILAWMPKNRSKSTIAFINKAIDSIENIGITDQYIIYREGSSNTSSVLGTYEDEEIAWFLKGYMKDYMEDYHGFVFTDLIERNCSKLPR